jgi:hypothetical protein
LSSPETIHLIAAERPQILRNEEGWLSRTNNINVTMAFVVGELQNMMHQQIEN